ncbi:MAG: hypothetical protein RIE59_10125 [Imperialibacter sp.]
MNESWAFWKEWPFELRRLFVAMAAISCLLILTVLGFEIAGHHLVLDWYLTSETETVKLALDRVSVGLFDLEIPADVYLVKQHFEGSTWIIRPWAGVVYLGLISLFYSLLLAVSTYLPRFWYMVASVVFIALLISMRLEQLLLLGWYDYKPLAIGILLFLPLSYYFHAFKSHIPLVKRFFAFTGSFILLAAVIYFGSQIETPFYTLAQYNFTAPVIIVVAFALLVGHEVVYFILRMITSGKAQAGSKNWVHFFTFSIFYLVNVGLAYAHNARYLTWDILYLNEFLMLGIAAVFGLWGLKAREARYEGTAPFYPIAAVFYIGLCGISFTTIGYQLLQGNDPVLEAFEDAILFSQLGFGVMFLLYIIVNFVTPLMRNLPVYRVVFKEGTLPYPTYRLAGTIAVTALFLLSNRVALNQSIAGYYNSLGDLYKVRNEQLLSEQYYLQGALYGYQNHKSNYQLGFIANSKEKLGEALYRFELAAGKNPSPHAFVNLSNQYQNTDQFFKGIFALQKGKSKFPSDGYIGNNLGVLYSSTNILDSAAFYFQQGLGGEFSSRAANANLGYVSFKAGQQMGSNEIEEVVKDKLPFGFLTNALATMAKNGTKQLPEVVEPFLPDSTLSGFTFPFVYNSALVDLGQTGGTLTDRLPAMVGASSNAGFYGPLSIAHALHLYYEGKASQAIQILNRVQQGFPTYRGYCFHLMSVMALDQGAAMKAAEYFESASAENYPDADINQAIALSEAGNWEQATLKWILLETHEGTSTLAESMLKLSETKDLSDLTTDQQRYQYLRWFGRRLNETQQDDLLVAFESESMKKAALVCLAQAYFNAGDAQAAQQLIDNPLLNDWAQPEMTILELELAIKEGGLSKLDSTDLINSLPPKYGRVWVNAAQAVKVNNATALKEAIVNNPFNAALAMAAADFLQEMKEDEAAYDVLVASIEANPYNPEVIRKYIWLALDMGFQNYAENGVIQLLDLLPSEEYKAFERAYAEKVAKIEAERESWNFD